MKGFTYVGETITVHDIVQYYYCPKKFYLLKVMCVPHTVRKKMGFGVKVHEIERRRMKERKCVYGFEWGLVEEVLWDLQLEVQSIKLRGRVDVVIRFLDGEMVPVEVKYTDQVLLRRPYLKQLYAYALLLDEFFKTNVKRGVLYFSKQRVSRMVEISHSDKREILSDIKKIIMNVFQGELILINVDIVK